jgi:hypothetical protein
MAVEEGASLATWRWCQSMGCRRMATQAVLLLSLLLLELPSLFPMSFPLPMPLPLPLLLPPLLGLG